MLRLTVAKNLNIFTKTLATNVDQTILSNRFVNHQQKSSNQRPFSLTTTQFCEEKEEDGKRVSHLYTKYAGTPRDRSQVIPVDTSIEYMKSGAFYSAYGGKNVWELYKRVHKGQFPRRKTRETCIRHNVIATASPCK